MTARDQAAGRIDRGRARVRDREAIVDLLQEGIAVLDEVVPLPVLAQPEVLVGLDLAGGVGVVQLDEVELT